MDIDRTYLRRQKDLDLERMRSAVCDRSGELSINALRNCTLSPVGQQPGASGLYSGVSVMIVDDCDFCAEVSHSRTDCRHINGKAVYCGYLRRQWGHFLVNSTARLWPLFSGFVSGDAPLIFFSDTPGDTSLTGNYLEFFTLAGIAGRVMVLDAPVSADEFMVPDISLESPYAIAREFLLPFRAVREAALAQDYATNVATEHHEKIFLTRTALKDSARNEINADRLDSLFAANGYSLISPEKLSLAALIRIMDRATEIAAVSGSLAHNILFGKSSAQYYILERTATNNMFQMLVEYISGFKVCHIDAFRIPAIASSTGQLFLFACTPQLKLFISDHGMNGVDWPDNDKQKRHELKKFFKRYRQLYKYSTGLGEWEIERAPAIAEAYCESYDHYAEWLSGKKPLFLSDMLSVKAIARRLLKRK